MTGSNVKTHNFRYKPKVFILSDISNEPDDAESLCRYLLYSNQFQTLGLVAVTSTWLKRKTHPEDMEKIIRAYGEVVDNLNAHVHPDSPYPSAQYFLDLVRSGPKVCEIFVCFRLCEHASKVVQEDMDSEPWGTEESVYQRRRTRFLWSRCYYTSKIFYVWRSTHLLHACPESLTMN